MVRHSFAKRAKDTMFLCGFDSHSFRHGPVAQVVEQRTFNPKVGGSRPSRLTHCHRPAGYHYGALGEITGDLAYPAGHSSLIIDSKRGGVTATHWSHTPTIRVQLPSPLWHKSHFADVAELAYAPRLERGLWGFKSLRRYDASVAQRNKST